MPKKMQAIIKKRVAEGHFSTPSDYLRSLVRDDIRAKDIQKERLEQQLLEGINSGPGVVYGTKEWDGFRTELVKHIKKTASNNKKSQRS
jgi:antitoxin ParD1/3/4